jgi:phosphoribosylglycinamide formyltransferase 1
MIKLAVLASGGGSNFKAILDKINENKLAAKVVLVISNNSQSGAMEKAKAAQIQALHLAPSAFSNEAQYTQALHAHLDGVQADLILLAGYMKRIPESVIGKYKNRILNIHPALLPAFGGKGMYGHHVHEAVISYGAKVTGVTIHLVDIEYDHGPIVMQKTADVLPNDTAETLAARVLKVEHDTYWRAIQLFAENRIQVESRKVIIR